MNSQELADEFSVAPETIRKYARKRGLKIKKVDVTMEKHPSWTGGTTTDGSGYILKRVYVDSEYGYLIRALIESRNSGYAPVHRIVMHDKLGRPLARGEVVDHIDGVKTNNHPDNLRVFSSNSEHLAVTLKGRIPNWTEDGKKRMTGRPPQSRK